MVGGLNFIVCPYQSIMQCPARKLVLSMTKSCMKSDILACKSPKGSGYIRHHKNNDLKHTIPQPLFGFEDLKSRELKNNCFF